MRKNAIAKFLDEIHADLLRAVEFSVGDLALLDTGRAFRALPVLVARRRVSVMWLHLPISSTLLVFIGLAPVAFFRAEDLDLATLLPRPVPRVGDLAAPQAAGPLGNVLNAGLKNMSATRFALGGLPGLWFSDRIAHFVDPYTS
jgi:hypothetical protein